MALVFLPGASFEQGQRRLRRRDIQGPQQYGRIVELKHNPWKFFVQ
jgi:hypothetical protein